MADDEADAVLHKLPYAWEPDDVDLVKRRFQDARPAVPRQLVVHLWRYWRQLCPDRMLFDDIEDNLALVVHAKAFGIHIQDGDAADPLTELTRRIDDPAEFGPILPQALTWGPRAALATQLRAALSCTLIRAWVAVDDQGPVEVLVLGEGLPEIRQQVVQAALTTSLRINGMTDPETSDFVDDLIGIGVIRITAGLAGKVSAIDLPSVFDARHVTVPDGGISTARAALRDFVVLLRSLERETNLVQVTEIRHPDLVEFDRSIRTLADRASVETHKALLRKVSAAGQDGIVSLLPYLRTVRSDEVRRGTSVGIELSPDLLATDSYLRLELAHQLVLAKRLTMDANLRLDRLESEIEWMKSELATYKSANKKERLAIWGDTVLLVEKFDEQLGIAIQLAEPEECATDSYFTANVPNLITMREGWAKRMKELVDNLEAAVHRPHAPARQLAAGRFLDAVLRDVTPDESPATERAFRRWRDQVAPMLWFEWRCALRRQGIAADDLFTRHTTFVTRYLPATVDDDPVLFTLPYSIVDEHLSAVLADSERGVLVVRDASDHAVGTDASESAEDADAVWSELVRTAERSSEEAFNAAFLNALRSHPHHAVQRMIEELHPAEPGPAEAEMIDNELRRAERATSLREGMDRALMAMRNNAFLTARECLDNVHAEATWEARVWLLRAIVECAAAEIPNVDIPDTLGSRLTGLPQAASRALDEAADLDKTYTEEWLKALLLIGLDKGIRRLFHGLPQARAACSEREYAVWLFRRAVESARLARQLEEAGEELSDEHEAIDVALVKLGKSLEDILIGPFVGGTRNEAQRLFEVLTGQEPPKYGRVAVR